MSADTAETTVLDPQDAVHVFDEGDRAVARSRGGALTDDREHAAALRDTWRALLCSRVLVWVAGVGAVVTFSTVPRSAFDPPHTTGGFGWLGDLLAAPAARWDAAWYLVIAHYGYRPDLQGFASISARAAFFPLYPLGLRAISQLGAPPVLAGVLLSMAALAAALYAIHRLTALEAGRLLGLRADGGAVAARSAAGGGVGLPPGGPVAGERRDGEAAGQPAPGRDVARLTVLAVAFAPMAYYFSAVYSESLYLALSVGVFWCARQGRWAWVGVLGALAGATRSAGLVLALPVVILYLYGPRGDRPPDFAAGRRRLLGIRYRVRGEALWLFALPLGVLAYAVYLKLAGGSALAPFHAQEAWSRHFAGPYVAVWDAARAAVQGARQLLSFQRHHVYYKLAGGDPFVSAEHNVVLFAFLLAAVPALVGVLRRLPAAYGAYVLAALALPLSYPVAAQPLMSLPRFLVVLFPLFMWFGAFLARHPRARGPLLVAGALALAFFTGQFATWHWVA